MEYPKKDIIKEITDLFEDYEETYVPGEWEEFSAGKKKKYPFYIYWLSAAAVAVLISSAVFFSIQEGAVKKKGNVQFSKIKPAAVRRDAAGSAVKDTVIRGSHGDTRVAAQQVQGHVAIKQPAADPEKDIAVKQTREEPTLAGNQEGAEPGRDQRVSDPVFTGKESQAIAKAGVQPVVTNIPVPEKEVKPEKGRLSMMDFLVLESKAAEKASKKTDARPKWDFGIQVMPSSTGSNVDFGGGITTAYRISDRISVSSGASLLQLQAGKDVPAAPVQPAYAVSGFSSLSSERKLTAISADIRAIDIPVSVIYKVSKRFYTGAGLSFFNVLSEKRSNTYYQTSQVDKMAVNPETGFVSTYKSLQTTEVMENAGQISVGQDPVKQNNSMGFFNFSIGRQQNIFDKYSIQIEPFIRVPLGKFSADNLNLLNSGIKFQLIF